MASRASRAASSTRSDASSVFARARATSDSISTQFPSIFAALSRKAPAAAGTGVHVAALPKTRHTCGPVDAQSRQASWQQCAQKKRTSSVGCSAQLTAIWGGSASAPGGRGVSES